MGGGGHPVAAWAHSLLGIPPFQREMEIRTLWGRLSLGMGRKTSAPSPLGPRAAIELSLSEHTVSLASASFWDSSTSYSSQWAGNHSLEPWATEPTYLCSLSDLHLERLGLQCPLLMVAPPLRIQCFCLHT